MRGRVRKTADYFAIRGWFYPEVQKVLCKWRKKFQEQQTIDVADLIIHTFLDVRRVFEDGEGLLQVSIRNREHGRFALELMTALHELHNPENVAGWVVKFCGLQTPDIEWKPSPRGRNGSRKMRPLRLLKWEEMQEEIRAKSGRTFSVDAIKKAAQRLKLTHSNPEELHRAIIAFRPPGIIDDQFVSNS